MGLDLEAQIDLDARLARDRDLGATELTARDARLGEGLADEAPSTRLAAWLDRVYAGTPRPGRRFATLHGRVRTLAWIAGLVLGVLAAAALLRYDGTVPINVVNVLAGLVGLQLLILATLLWHLARSRGQPLLHEGVRRALKLERFVVLDPAAERWLLVRLTQGFGIAFNLGALGAMWYLITFTDLAFAWSTTLGLQPASFHALTETLCAPFAWAGPAACPSDQVVAATQYFRQGARYAGGPKPDPAVVGAWWPFLMGCVAIYGLLPRLVLWAVAHARVRGAVARPRLDALEVQDVLRRLRPQAKAEEAATAPAAVPASRFSRAGIVAWRDLALDDDALRADAESRFGAAALFVRRAGSVHGDLEGAAAGAALAREAEAAALVYVERSSDFDKATARFVAGLRTALGARRPIVIVPVEPRAGVATDERKMGLWRGAVARVGDPYLGVVS